jgi:hypothetical protein
MRVLISHAVEDEPAATALKELIRRCSLNKVDVWFSSDRAALGGMPIGGPWFSELNEKLKQTDWIVAVVTPQSISSPWLYFECGFGACNRAHCVIPLAIGVPISSVPMPLAAYQIYDAANAASLATFLEKLLAADGIPYDDEMTKSVRDTTQRRMIEHQSKRALEHKPPVAASADAGDIATLRSFIEQRFVELYDMIPRQKRPMLSLDATFDISEFVATESSVMLNVPSTATVMDVLSEIYLRLEGRVEQSSYLVEWTVMDTKDDISLSIMEMAQRIPANVVFSSDRKYKVKRLSEGDQYFQNALRILKKRRGFFAR